MIKIAGKVAQPTTFPMYASLGAGRKTEIQQKQDARDNWYEWTSFEDFKSWAEETSGATEPTVTPIDPEDLKTAQREKRRYEAELNSQLLVKEIGSNHPYDNAPLTHLPNFDQHPNAPKGTFYRSDPKTGHLGLRQLKSEASKDGNDERRQQSAITIYTHPKTGKVHSHTNVGSDLIHSVVDTTANRVETGPPSKKKKLTQKEKMDRGDRNYADHTTEDFTTPDGNVQTMRGHAVGYADTIPQPNAEVISLDGTTKPYGGYPGYKLKANTKNGASKKLVRGSRYQSTTSNDNRSCYYAESDAKKGEDLGAKIKNHEHEEKTRQSGGTYVQSNRYETGGTTLNNKMMIPTEYSYLRDATDDTKPYASFKPGENLDKTAEEEWEGHSKPVAQFPAPKRWNSTASLLELFPEDKPHYTEAPPSPYFLSDVYSRKEEDMTDEPAIGEQQIDETGSRFMAFGETSTSGRYDIGRFTPFFEEPTAEGEETDKKAEGIE